MQSINIYGEEYYSVEKVFEFIELCNKSKKCIFCIEFFELKDEQVIPCEFLQSIDCTELYDEKNNEEINVTLCNGFVQDCISKSYAKIKNLYFNATLG